MRSHVPRQLVRLRSENALPGEVAPEAGERRIFGLGEGSVEEDVAHPVLAATALVENILRRGVEKQYLRGQQVLAVGLRQADDPADGGEVRRRLPEQVLAVHVGAGAEVATADRPPALEGDGDIAEAPRLEAHDPGAARVEEPERSLIAVAFDLLLWRRTEGDLDIPRRHGQVPRRTEPHFPGKPPLAARSEIRHLHLQQTSRVLRDDLQQTFRAPSLVHDRDERRISGPTEEVLYMLGADLGIRECLSNAVAVGIQDPRLTGLGAVHLADVSSSLRRKPHLHVASVLRNQQGGVEATSSEKHPLH
mmetsp:Transcript_53043/g.152868  ORF Transcript_53043/g.152868 Transcript_53043/m.152868 type:complete len:306 (+) Transcript_53043:1157-2074(+)